MKTLVIQLARFGDIFQTWPTLRALSRSQNQTHVLVRSRFRSALDPLPGLTVHELDTQRILQPLYSSDSDALNDAHLRLKEWIESLRAQKFEQIINLTFSPFSSYLVDCLTDSQSQVSVKGYCRHSDGYLSIADDSSAYFYAQVGMGRANRYHLTEVFSAVAGVDLTPDDLFTDSGHKREGGILIHLGASQKSKIYPAAKWSEVIKHLLPQLSVPITLIGGSEDQDLEFQVLRQLDEELKKNQVYSLVGKTNWMDLIALLDQACLLIGADSAPIHLASLRNTPVLNLSCASVNLYETGPLTVGSRILFAQGIEQIKSVDIADEAKAMLEAKKSTRAHFVVETRREPPVRQGFSEQELAVLPSDLEWKMLNALYTHADFPPLSNPLDLLALKRLFELSQFALELLSQFEDHNKQTETAQMLAQIDELVLEVGLASSIVDLIVRWFNTERLRLPPESQAQTLFKTKDLFSQLRSVSQVYCVSPANSPTIDKEKEVKHTERVAQLCKKISPSLREYNFVEVQEEFATLIDELNVLAKSSTKVGDLPLVSVLGQLSKALADKDFIEVADQLEFVLVPNLTKG